MVNPRVKEEKKESVEKVHYSFTAPRSLVAEIRLYLAKYFQAYGKKLTLTDFLLEAAREYMKNHPIDSEDKE